MHATWGRLIGVVIVFTAGFLLPATATDAGPDCAQPYRPGVAAITYPNQEGVPDGLITGEDLATHFRFGTGPHRPDSDGDGVPDTIDFLPPGDEGLATITRSDGVLRLHAPPHIVAVGTAGDLDGDGRDEIAVTSTSLSEPSVSQTYVLAGTTPPGDVVVSDVGVRIRSGLVIGASDRNSDGVPDLLVSDLYPPFDPSAPRTAFISGRGLLSGGPGSDARDQPVLLEVAGSFEGTAALGGPAPLVITSQVGADGSIVVRVADERGEQAFTTGPEKRPSQYYGTTGTVQLLRRADGTELLVLPIGSRSGNGVWIWRFDDPCGPLPGSTPPSSRPAPSGTVPVAPPAEPAVGAADFTG